MKLFLLQKLFVTAANGIERIDVYMLQASNEKETMQRCMYSTLTLM